MTLNPVEQRLAYLCGEWIQFRDKTDRRMLVWQVPDNSQRLVQAFFAAQKHETAYSSGDLFIVFDSPFEHSIQYARDLKASLAGQYTASIDDLAKEGLPTDWDYDPAASPESPEAFMAALCSFGSMYHHSMGHLVVVFSPESIGNTSAFAKWIIRALNTQLPERLRLVLVDSSENPRIQALSELDDPRILVTRPQIDAINMAQETFAQEPSTDPAGVFRNHFISLMALAEKGTADQLKARATDAFAFVQKHRWADQEVALHMLISGALLKEGHHAESIKRYEQARQVAQQTVAQAHPAGHKLVLQTWIGQAGAHFAANELPKATACYDEAAIVAQIDKNPILAIESLRMAAFCRTRSGDSEGAIASGHQALQAGATLNTPEARCMTTLPLAAVDLLRVIEPKRVQQIDALKGRLDRQLSTLQDKMETQVARQGATLTPAMAQAIEAQMEAGCAQARQDAESELTHLAAQGSAAFHHYFVQARQLMGAAWPLELDFALPGPDSNRKVSAS